MSSVNGGTEDHRAGLAAGWTVGTFVLAGLLIVRAAVGLPVPAEAWGFLSAILPLDAIFLRDYFAKGASSSKVE